MGAPAAQPSGSQSRLVLGIIAGGLALIVAIGTVSVVALSGDDDGAGAEPDGSDEVVPADPDQTEPSESEPPGPPAKVEFRPVLEVLPPSADCSKPGVSCNAARTEAYRLGAAELRTPDVVEAEARFSDYGQWVVGITLSDRGATRFEALTRELADNTGATAQLAIVVDDVLVSAPVVQGPIPGGQIDISADFKPAQAQRLAEAIDP